MKTIKPKDISYWLQEHFFYGVCYMANTRARVAQVLSKLPEKVQETLLQPTVYFCCFSPDASTVTEISYVCLPHQEVKRTPCTLIVLGASLERQNKKEAMASIGHEIAHYYLGHSTGGTTHPQNEKAAWALASEWGFSCPEKEGKSVDD